MVRPHVYDVFISYRRKDTERVQPLVAALRAESLNPWLDQREIGDFAPITDEIRNGLANSKALVVWYSADYPKSRPCQMELTAAFIAAQREGDPRQRVLVINPEASAAHVEPIELRDHQQPTAPSDPAGYAALARRIAGHVSKLHGTLGAIIPLAPPSQYGLKLAGASRFVGRLQDLWRVHSALHGAESAIISGAAASGLAQVSGLGGVGKSLLAEEYALRFAAAYPGGIFWLRAMGNDASGPASPDQQETQRADQFRLLAIKLGAQVEGLDPLQVEAALATRLREAGKPYLWIVDDLASGLGSDAVRAWLAPTPVGSSLITTRSREYGAMGNALPLYVLNEREAFELLCAHRKPEGKAEEEAARALSADLGFHPLAVDVAGAALAAQEGLQDYAGFRAAVVDPEEDELELAAELADVLPSGHEKSVASTLLRSVRALGDEGRDFLRLAAALAVAPIAARLVAATFRTADELDESSANRRAALALKQTERASLAERGEGGSVSVHALVSRAVRFHDPKPEQAARLRQAAMSAMNEALPAVADIRSHTELALNVLHAREICARGLGDAEAATLAGWVARHDYERGGYEAARRLQEQVLDIRQRILGSEHPDTSIAAWNLLYGLAQSGDDESAVEVFRECLAWLPGRDPASLGAYQQRIRQMLVEMITQAQQEAQP